MRDPKRIQRVLKKIDKIWMKQPDLRLGQIIDIVHVRSGTKADVFNVEDDILEEGIDSLLNAIDPPSGTL